MSPILVTALVAVPAGALAYWVTRQWPRRDPLAPRLAPDVIEHAVRRHPRARRLLRSRFDPASETGLLLTAALAGAIVALTGVGLLARMIHSGSGLASYDLAFARWGGGHATKASTRGLQLVSLLGGYPVLIGLSIVVAGLEYRRGAGNAVVAMLALVVGGQFAVVSLVKAFVNRPRPDILRLTGFSGASFPSGHAAAATAAFAAYSLLLGRRRSPAVKAALAGAAAAVATAVASTRVLLGVHWFTDVLAGVAVGWVWFTVISIAFGGRILRFGAPVAQAEAVRHAIETKSTGSSTASLNS